MTRDRWTWIGLVLGAALPLARVLPDPLHRLPGLETGDVYKHAWGFWHTLQSLGTWPRTSLLNAPEGGVLLDVMLLPALLLAPVTTAAGPVLSSNLWVFLSLLALGAATWGLAHACTGSRMGALAAALAAQTTPFLAGHALASGVHERLSLWIFPFVVLALFRIREQGGWRWPVLMGGALLFTTVHCHTYGYLAMVCALASVPALVQSRRDALRLLPPLALVLALQVLVLVAVHHLVHLVPYLAGVPAERADPGLGVRARTLEVSTLRALLDPTWVAHQAPKRVDDELHNIVYLGWVLVGASLLAAWRGGPRMRGVLALALLFVLLSLGPVLPLGSVQVENPLYLAAAGLLPVMGSLPALFELAGVGAVLASVSLACLEGPTSPGAAGPLPPWPGTGSWRRWGTWGLVGLLLAERAWVPPVPWVAQVADARIPPVHGHLSEPGIVLDLPRTWKGQVLAPGAVFLFQTVHGQPLPFALNLGVSPLDTWSPVRTGGASRWDDPVACLRSRGIRWVVVHGDWYDDPRDARETARGLSAVVGPPLAMEGTRLLFDLGTSPPGSPLRGCPEPGTAPG